MNAVAVAPIFRGVSCRLCGTPIRLPAALMERQAATETNQNPDLVTKVFPARCRRCHKEGLYTLAEITDFPGR
jgi:hypothetical protein